MKATVRPSLLALLLTAAPPLWAPPALAAAPQEQAQEDFEAGQDAYNAGQYAKAYEAFSRAYRIHPSYDITANLAFAELKLGKNREAAEHLAQAMRLLPPSLPSRAEAVIRQKYSEARGLVAVVHIETNAQGASLSVDGRPQGALPRDVFLDPGSHELAISAPSYIAQTRKLEVSKGQSAELRIELQAAAPEPPKPTAPAPAGAQPSSGRAWVTLGLGAASLASLGAALAFRSAAASAEDDKDRLQADPSATFPNTPARADLVGARERYDDAATFHNLFLAAGGALAAGAAATWFLWPNAKPSTAWIAPAVGTTGMTLQVGGRY